LITLATYGIGMLIGFYIAGVITDTYRTANNLVNWNVVWLIPAGIAALVMILFALFFKENKLVKIK
jgi:MFS family permease